MSKRKTNLKLKLLFQVKVDEVGTPYFYWTTKHNIITVTVSNCNRTEWSPIRAVIIRVIPKSRV